MNRKPEIAYGHQGWWEAYSEELLVEYQQCMEEGKDIEAYRELFENVQKMPPSAYKARMADVLYELQLSLPQKQDYPYNEPDDLESIRTLRPEWKQDHHAALSKEKLEDQVLGAWIGRTCGCLLGKPIEGIRRKDLYPLLQESGNWPLHRYLVSSDISESAKRKTASLPSRTVSAGQIWWIVRLRMMIPTTLCCISWWWSGTAAILRRRMYRRRGLPISPRMRTAQQSAWRIAIRSRDIAAMMQACGRIRTANGSALKFAETISATSTPVIPKRQLKWHGAMHPSPM